MFISVYFFDVVYEPPLICISYRHKAEMGELPYFCSREVYDLHIYADH